LAQISVIIPTLNAAQCVSETLESVDIPSLVVERLVVDGGSDDETRSVATAAGARIIEGHQRGRGMQLAAGAAAAQGGWLLFLHADTVLQDGWATEAERFVVQQGAGNCAAAFRFGLDHESPGARRLEAMVAWRCRVLALPYGDQGLLISRVLYEEIGGFKAIPLFEDVDIMRRIGRARLVMLKSWAVTSAIRYQKSGYLVRSLRNLLCLALYRLGVPPHRIVRLYGVRP
jgi:rSAM/selenodomain-associated transferase 2